MNFYLKLKQYYIFHKLYYNMSLQAKLNSIIGNYSGSFFQSLTDLHQTHAIYGISKLDKDTVKEALKKIGANKFRMVQPHAKDKIIICFSAKNIIN